MVDEARVLPAQGEEPVIEFVKYDYNNPKVGDVVYQAFSPKKAGKIVKLLEEPTRTSFWKVRVKYVNGNEEDLSAHSLNCFKTLIADHERKLQTHRDTLARIEGGGK